MLIDNLLFGDQTAQILKKTLDALSQRQVLVSSNISNIDTPGYKAKDINFASQLSEIMDSGNNLSLTTTNSRHIGHSGRDVDSVEFEVFEESDPARADGNNVNLDKEMIKLAENQIQYNAAVQLLTKRTSTILAAINESAQSR